MPEGPSIVLLKEAVQSLAGKKIVEASGSSITAELRGLAGMRITAFKTWGKHFLICLPRFTIRIHLLMFGSYTLDEQKSVGQPRLSLFFARNRSLHFYACAVTRIDEPLDTLYDWSADIMNPAWSGAKALKKLRMNPRVLISDALLDQHIFSDSGNIIKNEVLFNVRIHPESKVGEIPPNRLRALVREVVTYSFQFLEWKKAFMLRKHWNVYTKKKCPRDGRPIRKKYTGKTKRRTFYCTECQVHY